MTHSAVSGIIFANTNDTTLKKLTKGRSMASVPFGARYRFVDFALSSLVNAGATNVGIITKENYSSLMNHVGNGSHWELDRRYGGLHLLPPYFSSKAKRYTGTVDALYGIKDYIKNIKNDYIVLYNSDFIANVDISAAVAQHILKNADVTMVYCDGSRSNDCRENMNITLDSENRVKNIKIDNDTKKGTPVSMGITIIKRQLLLKFVDEAYESDIVNFNRDFICAKLGQLKVYGFEHKGYICFMNSIENYFKSSMDLLDSDIRRELFNTKRPILTKTRDDMPSRYGTKAKTSNCIIADGCVIDGTVKDSILFRGVKVAKGAVVENCILMQGTSVGAGSELFGVISDKNVVIGENMVLKGSLEKQLFIKKNQIV